MAIMVKKYPIIHSQIRAATEFAFDPNAGYGS